MKRVYAAVAGRYIIGGADKKEKKAGRLYLIKKEMKDWCSKNRIELNSVLDYARKSGFLIHESERFTVTRVTELSTINLRCVALDMNKMSDAVTQSLKLVVHTNPHADNHEGGMGVKH